MYDALADAVAGADRPVVVSGGCNASVGVLAGLQRGGSDPAVVWFDAHGDVQTLETTASGYLGGIALRLLVGYRPELIADRLGLRPLAEDRVVLVDARDLDPPEAEYLAGAAIRRCDGRRRRKRFRTGRCSCTSTSTSSTRRRCPACGSPPPAARRERRPRRRPAGGRDRTGGGGRPRRHLGPGLRRTRTAPAGGC